MFVCQAGVSLGNVMFSNCILFVSANTVLSLLFKNSKGEKITKAAFFSHSFPALCASHPVEN